MEFTHGNSRTSRYPNPFAKATGRTLDRSTPKGVFRGSGRRKLATSTTNNREVAGVAEKFEQRCTWVSDVGTSRLMVPTERQTRKPIVGRTPASSPRGCPFDLLTESPVESAQMFMRTCRKLLLIDVDPRNIRRWGSSEVLKGGHLRDRGLWRSVDAPQAEPSLPGCCIQRRIVPEGLGVIPVAPEHRSGAAELAQCLEGAPRKGRSALLVEQRSVRCC